MHLDLLVLPTYKEIWADPPYCEGPKETAEFLDRFAQEVFPPRACDVPMSYVCGYAAWDYRQVGHWQPADGEHVSRVPPTTQRRTRHNGRGGLCRGYAQCLTAHAGRRRSRPCAPNCPLPEPHCH